MRDCVLLNAGSSSLSFCVFGRPSRNGVWNRGAKSRAWGRHQHFCRVADGGILIDRKSDAEVRDDCAALSTLLAWLRIDVQRRPSSWRRAPGCAWGCALCSTNSRNIRGPCRTPSPGATRPFSSTAQSGSDGSRIRGRARPSRPPGKRRERFARCGAEKASTAALASQPLPVFVWVPGRGRWILASFCSCSRP
jgi:hypothetical protein